MQPIYAQLRERARQITAEHPRPSLYRDYPGAYEHSRGLIASHPMIRRLLVWVAENLEDDFGHGLQHAVKVAEDAGMLVNIECRRVGCKPQHTERRVLIAQSAGLLHDIRRKHPRHAQAGAETARQILASFALTPAETEDICIAIRNHEAFQPTVPVDTTHGRMISNCLYDADKFRWGPDNFLFTLWGMVSYLDISLPDFVRRYPRGMQGLAAIKSTFRTRTGRIYGPEFIDIGIAIGEALFEVIQTEFASQL